jgi:AGCS family alanine or glycine:cation symporter
MRAALPPLSFQASRTPIVILSKPQARRRIFPFSPKTRKAGETFFMELLQQLNEKILWGVPMMFFMLAAGICLTFTTRGVIFKNFRAVMKNTAGTLLKRRKKGETGTVSPFAAVSTALAATVGTGNIVGVAIAIRIGGPGAVFWMWISALFGMVIKYSEVTLALSYREKNASGNYVGGPMYYMTKGLHSKFLAVLFCCFAFLSSFGIGNMVQANSLAGGIKAAFGIDAWISGVVLSILCGAVLIGGIKRISSVAEILVPFMALSYMLAAAAVLFINAGRLPQAFSLIIRSAFSGAAPIGGFSGAGIMYAARIGVSRGLFTNEAGLGSAPIAHAAADTDHPARQGMWGAFEVFFDTIVMCTITALVIITSGVWTAPESIGGEFLAHSAFSAAFPGGGLVVSAGLVLFAFASIIAWYYYGERCVDFLFGEKGIPFYRVLYVAACFFGCVADIAAVWEISDTLNALMALPNLISLLLLAPEVGRITKDFFSKFT